MRAPERGAPSADHSPSAPVRHDGGVADTTLPADRFLNRELSWLDFNARVLELAEDETLPLLERVKFLAIFASNLDVDPDMWALEPDFGDNTFNRHRVVDVVNGKNRMMCSGLLRHGKNENYCGRQSQ